MDKDQNRMSGVCNSCGCDRAQAVLYARAIDFEAEFLAGLYDCCQVVQWSEEQWLAWREAACEDGKTIDEVMPALGSEEPEKAFVKVQIRRPRGESGPFGEAQAR